MNDYIEEDVEFAEPHSYVECRESHLVERQPHCAYPHCDAGPEHPIHRTAKERAA